MNDILYTVTVWVIPVLLAITLHEAAHAYVARYFGDLTAYQQGRMSLNPIKHIDPIGTILLPAVLLLLKSPFIFGYAKPVPVQFGNLRNPKRDSAFVALAGPGANLIMAFLWQVGRIISIKAGFNTQFMMDITQAGLLINLVLFAFNLFPLPPLDGGRILTSLLPDRLAYRFASIERYGFFILLALLYFNLLNYWMRPIMQVAATFIRLLVSPLLFLLSF